MMRSTEDKLIHVPLNVGMNQAQDARLAPTGTLSSVQNCRIAGNGVLEKRPGSLALSGTTANSPTHSLTGNGSTINLEQPCFACQVQSALMVGNTYGDAFAYSTVWQFQGRFSTCLPVRKRYGLATDDTFTGGGNGFGIKPPDIVATSSGYIGVVALTTSGDLHAYIEDQNGVRLFYRVDKGGYSRVRVVAQGDTIHVIVEVGGTLLLASSVIADGVVTTSAPVLIATLAASNWDVSPYSSTAWFLAYQSSAAVMRLVQMNGSSTIVTQTFAVTGSVPVTLWANSIESQLWVGFYDNPSVTGDVKYSVWDISVSGAITTVKGATTLKSGLFLGPPMFGRYRGVAVNTTKKTFYCFVDWSGSPAGTWVGAAFGSATAPTTPVACWQVAPIAKPDNYNRVWCMTNSASSNELFSRVVLLRFADESLSAPPTIELSGPNMPSPATLAASSPFTTNARWFSGTATTATRSYAVLPNIFQVFYSNMAIEKFDVYEYTTAEQEPHRQVTRYGQTAIVAGQPVEFWGQSVSTINNALTSSLNAGAFAAGASEIGFPHAPIVFSIAQSNTSVGGTMTPGTRSFRVTYEWIDMYGRRHQSPPSNPVSLTNDNSHVSATLTIGSTDITQRQAANIGLRCFIRLYRTVAGGTEYHECAQTVEAFNQATGIVTLTNSESDTNIAQTGFLYTDGGVLDNTLAPACRFTAKSEDRIWFGGLWESNIIQCSKVLVPGEPIQCTDDFSHQVQLPAPCTGLAYMDGNVVAFTADAIYLVSGDGPNDQGAGSFSPPRALTRSVGCVDYRSVVETNIGLLFQSNQGFYLLPRGFGPAQYIGAAIRSDMDALSDLTQDFGPAVLGAISHSTRGNHLARFLVAPGTSPASTAANDVFTYDIDSGQWFHDTLVASMGEIGAYDSLDSIGKKGAVFVHASLSTVVASPVSIESTAQPGDESGAYSVTQFAETAWIHPFGLGGYGKVNSVLVAAESLGDTQTLDLTVQTDTNTADTAAWVITGAQVNYRSLALTSRACTAVQIQIRCDAPANAVGGFKFISCTLEVEPTGGIRLLSDSEKA